MKNRCDCKTYLPTIMNKQQVLSPSMILQPPFPTTLSVHWECSPHRASGAQRKASLSSLKTTIYLHVHLTAILTNTVSIPTSPSTSTHSNRKHGYDAYKISKVLIYDKFITSGQIERNQFNCALLYIQGQHNLKDKYGFIGISQKNNFYDSFTYLSCSLNNQNELQFASQYRLEDNPSTCLSGCPIIYEGKYGKRCAKGLLFQEDNNSKPLVVNLNFIILYQFRTWAKTRNGDFSIGQLKSADMNQLSFLQGKDKRPINRMSLWKCQLNDEQFFLLQESLPFSSISRLRITSNEQSLNYAFLKLDKFKDLKELDLQNNKINPFSCNLIVEASLLNLRSLNLSCNPIGVQGCKLLAKGKWPFLREVLIYKCGIMNEGLGFICQARWPNLNSLNISDNSLDDHSSQVLKKADFPRIEKIDLSISDGEDNDTQTISSSWESLLFLKSVPWKSLKDMLLINNLVGNKGCKLIKQSGIAFRSLWMSNCHIDDVGVKWLCKADLSRIVTLNICWNNVGNQGCEHLCRTYVPKLNQIEVNSKFNSKGVKISVKGLRCFLKTEWTDQAIHRLTIIEFSKYSKQVFKGRINDRLFV